MMALAKYKPIPIAVPRSFWDLVVDTYPALWQHPDAEAYRHIMQYALFSTFTDEETGRIVLPHETVAALVGSHPHRHGFRASDWIERFGEDVLPLNPSDFAYVLGRARVIDPDIDPA